MSTEESHDLNEAKNKSEQNVEIIPGYKSINQLTKDGFVILMEAIRNSNALPNGRDWSFYNAHESFTKIVNEEGNNLLKQINTVLRQNRVEGNIRNRVLEEKTELMIEANDMILERVANNIDEINGIRKTVIEPVLIQTVSAQLPINGSWNRVQNATFSVSSSITSETSKKSGSAIRLLTGKNIVRPQKFFKDKVINSSKYPWEPRIKEKPNSLKPLAIFLEETDNGQEYSHPYEYELDRFAPSPDQLKKEIPTIPLLVDNTPLIEVNSPEQVDELVETLRNCKEFAVDLEHHSYRSFMGITCLMQISTREKDYLIDTLALRDKLYVLNEVFTKPSIVKIFHGADMDIKWLQRDLSLYVVNMFDTYWAAKRLGYSALSLTYLMQRFCNFIPNKQFQLADWRIRPLPIELKMYAREDTHYLIYIYEKMKNELIDKANGQDNLLMSVITASTETCKKRYFRPRLREDSHLDFYRKCKRLFDNRQLYALKELYKWRDQISREEDESTGYVLPNHMLLQISESLPREMQGILACCNPIPPLVRANLLELHQIILRAKEQPLEKPILKEDTRARGITKKISKLNVDSPLHCPHDLTKTDEFRDDLPTLLGNTSSSTLRNIVEDKLEIERDHSTYSVFDTPEHSDEGNDEMSRKLHSFTFLGPFERYKLVKPYIQAEEERLAAEKACEVENKEVTTDAGETSEKDTRTDEERRESIRQLFLTLSRKVNNETPPDQSLVQMGGSKKRKREVSPQAEPDNCRPDIDLQTPLPNLGFDQNTTHKRISGDMNDGDGLEKNPKWGGRNQGQNSARKRKSGDMYDPEEGDRSEKCPKWSGKNQGKQKQKFKNKNKNNQEGANDSTRRKTNEGSQLNRVSDQHSANTLQKQKKKKNKQMFNSHQQGRGGSHGDNNDRPPDNYHVNQQHERDSCQSDNQREKYNQGGSQNEMNNEIFHIDAEGSTTRGSFRGAMGGKKGKWKGNRGKPKDKNVRGGHQSGRSTQEENFEAFDYASVDFRQFQGGAGGTHTPREFKSTVRGKGKKRGEHRANNKFSSFGNYSRGRGRSR